METNDHRESAGDLSDNELELIVIGTNDDPDPTPPEILLTLRIQDVHTESNEATAVIGPRRSRRKIGIAFPSGLADEFARLSGRRATVLGTAIVTSTNQQGKVKVDAVDVEAVGEGPPWMTVTEMLVSTNAWPPAPVDTSGWPKGFDFDVDEFLELIYEGRGRTWAESKIKYATPRNLKRAR